MFIATIATTAFSFVLLAIIFGKLVSRRRGRHLEPGLTILASAKTRTKKLKTAWSPQARRIYADIELANTSDSPQRAHGISAFVIAKLSGGVNIPLNPQSSRTYFHSLELVTWLDGDNKEADWRGMEFTFLVDEFYFGNGLSFDRSEASYVNAYLVEYEPRCIVEYKFDFNGKSGEKLSQLFNKDWLAKSPDLLQVQTAGSRPLTFEIATDDLREWSERFPHEFLKFVPPTKDLSVDLGAILDDATRRDDWRRLLKSQALLTHRPLLPD